MRTKRAPNGVMVVEYSRNLLCIPPKSSIIPTVKSGSNTLHIFGFPLNQNQKTKL